MLRRLTDQADSPRTSQKCWISSEIRDDLLQDETEPDPDGAANTAKRSSRETGGATCGGFGAAQQRGATCLPLQHDLAERW